MRDGRVPRARHAGHPAARGVDLLGPVRDPELQRHLHGRLHAHDADRCLSRRRPAGGDVRPRADDGRARQGARHGPGRAPAEELRQGVPAHDGVGADHRLGRLPRDTRPPARAPRPRRDPCRSGWRAERAATRSRSGSASRRTTRCAVSPRRASSARSATPSVAGTPRRFASSRSAPSRWSPVRRRTVRATRRPSRRSSPTSSASTSTTSRSSTATPPSSQLGMDTYGSRSLTVGGIALYHASEKIDREGPADRRAPARGVRGRPRARERARSR